MVLMHRFRDTTTLRLLERLPVILTLALVLLVALAIASSYVGDSHSPYGMCYGASGRPIPCEILEKRR